MAHRQLVLAVFPDEGAADSAALALKDSDIADGDAIGVLALDADGKLKQDKVGKRSTGKGAAIGGVIAVFSTAVLGPAVLARAAGGALHHKNPGLSDADKARPTLGLNTGPAAGGVMSPSHTAPPTSDFLTKRGGANESHQLHHKNLGLSDADKARLTVDLNAGQAAVGVMSHSDTAPAISDFLTKRGGATESHELTDEAVEAAGVEPAAV